MKFKLRAWTGPSSVTEIAAELRRAGVTVECEGTEHVYVVAEGSHAEGAAWDVFVDLNRVCGRDFGLRFRSVGKEK